MADQRPRLQTPPLEIVLEILLRLSPRKPACLLRASLACKSLVRAVSDLHFRSRLHLLHRTPPVLGFLHNWEDRGVPRFIPTTDSPFSLAAPDCRSWRALDCRHGRALFLSRDQDTKEELLVWDPVTGSRQRVPVPAAFEGSEHGAEKMSPTAAVFCAAHGCHHHGCRGGPFRLVFVFSVEEDTADEGHVTSACVYSSETGTWGEPASMNSEFSMNFTHYSSVLVQGSLLYFMSDDDLVILEYDLAGHVLTELDPPDNSGYVGRFNIVLAQDGGLGVCQYMYPKLRIWTRDTSDGTDQQWVPGPAIFLDGLLPIGGLLDADSTVQVMGFPEEANVIFLNAASGIFTVELQSRQVRKVCDTRGFCNLIPVVSFYTPVPGGEHQRPALSGPIEEASHGEGEVKEKTVDQAQQLFDKGSNAIKEGGQDLETRDTCYGETAPECASMEDKHGHALPSEAHEVTDPFGEEGEVKEKTVDQAQQLFDKGSNAIKEGGQDLETRDPCYGDIAPECASMEDKHGHALPSEAHEVTDPLGDVPSSALNEELVKSTSTTSKDDAGNSKTSGSNAEDAALSSEKTDS